MNTKSITITALAALVAIAGITSAVHIHRLETRVKALENAQSVQLARTRVFIRAMEQSERSPQLLESAKLLVAVLEPDPQAAVRAFPE
jgi:hypothetical protein